MNITDIFTDQTLVSKIQKRLPELFYLAELESSRAGKVGMEVGSVREKISLRCCSTNLASKMSKPICQSTNPRPMSLCLAGRFP